MTGVVKNRKADIEKFTHAPHPPPPSATVQQAAALIEEVVKHEVAQILGGCEERAAPVEFGHPVDEMLQSGGRIDHEGVDSDVFTGASRHLE
ncbi:MAG: hypothetical protein KDB20_16910, partial [Microthrixaceae bacterium]|nr:hypothetical protein [Microthrixaceae bacterium]